MDVFTSRFHVLAFHQAANPHAQCLRVGSLSFVSRLEELAGELPLVNSACPSIRPHVPEHELNSSTRFSHRHVP